MAEWLQYTIVVCAGLLTVLNLVNTISQLVNKTKQPTTNLENRVVEIERKISRYDEMFGRDKARLDSFDGGMKVMIKALLAIMKHDLDGNNTDALKQASAELQEYMVNR